MKVKPEFFPDRYASIVPGCIFIVSCTIATMGAMVVTVNTIPITNKMTL